MMMMTRLRLKTNSSEQHTTSTYLQLLQHPDAMEEQDHKQSVGQAAPIGHREHPGEVSNALFIVSFHFLGMNFFSPMDINRVASEVDAITRRARYPSLGSIQ
jgi:hypothetical protein